MNCYPWYLCLFDYPAKSLSIFICHGKRRVMYAWVSQLESKGVCTSTHFIPTTNLGSDLLPGLCAVASNGHLSVSQWVGRGQDISSNCLLNSMV